MRRAVSHQQNSSSSHSIVIPSSSSSPEPNDPPFAHRPATPFPRPIRPLPMRGYRHRPTTPPVGIHGIACSCATCIANVRIPHLVERWTVTQDTWLLFLLLLELGSALIRLQFHQRHLRSLAPTWRIQDVTIESDGFIVPSLSYPLSFTPTCLCYL